MKGIEFTFAAPPDEKAVRALIRACGLPDQDIDEHLRHFILARSRREVVGVVGLEPLARRGLLRSLAVAAPWRRQGLAKKLCERITAYARSRGVSELYLLTNDAEALFAKLGFTRIDRDELPESIRATREFRFLCPATAVSMLRRLV
jgi:amino-acid N-acetyltransferase